MGKMLKRLTSVAVEGLILAVLDPFYKWLIAGFFLILPGGTLLLKNKGLLFFTQTYEIPVWVIATTAGLTLALLFLLLQQQLQKSDPFQKQKPYTLGGLEWVLTPNFWFNHEHCRPDEASPSFLSSMVHGPVCANCKTAITIHFPLNSENVCPECHSRFDLENLRKTFPDEMYGEVGLTRAVYSKAQAAAKRKEL
jgi:hypothetical protein